MSKKLFWTMPVIMLAILIGGAVKTYAGTDANSRGWLWGGGAENNTNTNPSTLGWVSMNNVDTSGTDANGAVSYGVNIPSAGAVTGYAWSENYGWISFNGSDLTGCSPDLSRATRSDNSITGGARILSIKTDYENEPSNSGGWMGCVSLNGTVTNGSSYGVTINSATGTLDGYAWSDEIGWIDFSRASIALINGACGAANNKNYAIGTSDYGTDTQCETGISSNTAFPSPTNLVFWTCQGSNGGRDARCTATRNCPSGTTWETTTSSCVCHDSWIPDPADTCTFQTVTQTTSNCGPTKQRIVNGTKTCAQQGWHEIAPTTN